MPTENISPPLTSWPTYRRYDSSSTGYRGFCSRCGSSISFTCFDKEEETELWIGTLDEEVLVGRKLPGSGKETSHGTEYEREGGVGEALCVEPSSHTFMQNAIPGATDKRGGLKFWRNGGEGVPGYE